MSTRSRARETAPGLALTVLGSGGPFVTRERVSSGYLVWLDGRPLLLVDAGGGVFQRLGQAGIDPTELDAILLTHLHIDHSGGLAPIVFAAYMSGRTRPLTVAGPMPNEDQPGGLEFCERLFGPAGAWRYLHSFDGFGIDALESVSDPDDPAFHELFDRGGVRIRSVSVPHGMMPAVSYRIDVKGKSVVITGDVSRFHPPLAALARDVDLLIHDMALPERDVPHSHLHARPSEVGRLAAASNCRQLLLGHVMPELEAEKGQAELLIRAHYDRPLTWATDLMFRRPASWPVSHGRQSL